MPDEPSAGSGGTGQESGTNQPPEGGAASTQGADGKPTGNDGQPFDPERAQALIDKQRAELKELKAQAKAGSDAAAKLKQLEDAQKTELERAQERASELEAKLTAAETRSQELQVRGTITEAARAAGATRPDLLHRLVDMADLEYAEDGTPKNVDSVVGKLKEQAPELFGAKPASADQGARTTAPGAEGDMNSLLRQAAGRTG